MGNEALANPKVLEWARRMAGLEEEEAARKLNVKPDRILEWERGSRRPTVTQLRKIADTYKRPLGVFFLDAAPPDDPLPDDYRRVDPTDAEPLSPRLRLAIRTAHARRYSALELYEDLGDPPPDFTLGVRRTDSPEAVGARVRAALGLEGAPPLGEARAAFNRWRSSAERAGVLVFQADGVSVGEMRGFSISEHPLPAVVLNIKDSYSGRSFSLLHELTHVALNHGGLCDLEVERRAPADQDIEVFCNHAAGAALLPSALLLAELRTLSSSQSAPGDEQLSAIASRHGVSDEVVLRRLLILGRVTQDQYEAKRKEFVAKYAALAKRARKNGGRPSQARLAVARGGRFFTRLVLEAYETERITSSDVADLLGTRLKHLDRIRSEVEDPTQRGEGRR